MTDSGYSVILFNEWKTRILYKNPLPPGEYLKEELQKRGWTQADLAMILGKHVPAINEVIQGKRAITIEMAAALGTALGTDPDIWMHRESAYRLSKIDQDPEIQKRARLYDIAPIKEMERRGWIEKSENVKDLENATSLQQLAAAGQAMEDWQKAEAKARLPELLQKLQELRINAKDLAGLNNPQLAELMRCYLAGSQCKFPSDPTACSAMMEAMKAWLLAKGDKAGKCKLGAGCEGSYLTETEALRVSCCRPGKGGVTRGRGDAELTFGDEVQLENKAFLPRQLPEGMSPSADYSMTISVETLDPKAAPVADKTHSDKPLESNAKAEGRTASVPLRYRKLVNQYFSPD